MRLGLSLVLAAAALGSMMFGDCSSSEKTAAQPEFVVEYYTAGGFAGTSEGFTLSSDGLVSFWRGRTPDIRAVTDSLRLESEALDTIAAALAHDDLYTVKSGEAENLNNVVSIHYGTKSTVIMFSPISPPAGATASFKQLLTELQKIHKPNN